MAAIAEPPKRKRGRPSLYTEELAEEIAARLSAGQTLLKISEDENMPDIRTLLRWQVEKPDFCQLSTRARENGTHILADECIAIADNPTLDPNDKRIRIDTRLRLIGKWNAKKYGDKIAMEHEHQHKFIPLDELEEKVKRIRLEKSRLLEVGPQTLTPANFESAEETP